MSQFSPNVYPWPTQPPPLVPLTDHKNPYDLNHNIMLTAIISLSVVILLVIALHIYARCVLQRQARRRAAIHQLGFTAAHAPSGEPPSQGLEPSVIAMLPMFVFKQVDNSTDDDGNNTTTECAVCLCTLEDEEMARLLPNCKHTFHAECVDKWFGSHSTCPICRTEAQPRPQPEPREGPVGDSSTTPPLERIGSVSLCSEGTSDCAAQPSPKIGGSSSRLNSFRRILSRERSSRRVHSCGQEDGIIDLERQ
ncbi:E3 ubiquitin-protein ligase ATL41 [Ziziphus jujuba]|uniref:RING-type E3 ubiquitin transferase n=2 Tax=Ziziphus jujuba TaxID=326968 RepID=A0A6P3ZQ25_ZIZJJ|nr:E3 ubiquitin-protein ligase ATL41 [Ziziphus jujuba]KAH7533169.1 hypothetical protein FEM48_Zijuj04G0101800 [Ziziphus jujuba var. spinosa]